MTKSAPLFAGENPGNHDKYPGPLIFREYAEDMANRITLSQGGTLLELAAGTGTPLRLQIDERAPGDHSKIVEIVKQAIGNEFGFNSLTAIMQAIVFEAGYPG